MHICKTTNKVSKTMSLIWRNLILRESFDMLALYNSCQAVRDLLPRPGYADGDTKWYSFMVSRQHYWKDFVNKYTIFNSEQDADRVTRPITAENILAHKCPECPALFPCAKSCLMHRKRVHNYTDPIVLRIDGSGKCAARNFIFHSRIRVLRHVMDGGTRLAVR